MQDGPTWRPEAIAKGGKRQFPYMIDPNTGTGGPAAPLFAGSFRARMTTIFKGICGAVLQGWAGQVARCFWLAAACPACVQC